MITFSYRLPGRFLSALISMIMASSLIACAPVPVPKATTSAVPKTPTPIEFHEETIAVVGDSGVASRKQRAVANMVAKHDPAFVVMLGDNRYKKKFSYQRLVGDYYPQKLVAAVGNHDYDVGIKYFDKYFGTNSKTRNFVYQSESGIDFFVLDSTRGLRSTKIRRDQKQWLKSELLGSNAEFKVVVLHHPPFSSSEHGSTKLYQWDFGAMDVDLVLSGHDHTYERITRGGTTFVVAGTGGAPLYDCGKRVSGSRRCLDTKFGALFLYSKKDEVQVVFRAMSGKTFDSFKIPKN